MYRAIKASYYDEVEDFNEYMQNKVDDMFLHSEPQIQYELYGQGSGFNIYGDFYVNELLELAKDVIPDWVDLENQDFWRIQFPENPIYTYCRWDMDYYGQDLLDYLVDDFSNFFESEEQIEETVKTICNSMQQLCSNCLEEARNTLLEG